MQGTINRVWNEVANLDWDGWFPVVEIRRGEIIVADVVPADADTADLTGLIPIDILKNDTTGDEIIVAVPGWQIGFMREDDYREMMAG